MAGYEVRSKVVLAVVACMLVGIVLSSYVGITWLRSMLVAVFIFGGVFAPLLRATTERSWSWLAISTAALVVMIGTTGTLIYDALLNSILISEPLAERRILAVFVVGGALSITYSIRGSSVHMPTPNHLRDVLPPLLAIAIIGLMIAGAMRLRVQATPDLLIVGYCLSVLPLWASYRRLDSMGGLAPTTLWLLSIAFFLPYALRSDYLTGGDTSINYWYYSYIDALNTWTVLEPSNHLSSTLSGNLLPVVITRLTGVSAEIAFSIGIPLLFTFTVFGMYEFTSQRFSPQVSFLSTGIFMSSQFFYTSPRLERTAVALVLFMALLVCLFDSERTTLSSTLGLLFAAGIPMSHYGTAYIGLGILGIIIAASVADRIVLDALGHDIPNSLRRASPPISILLVGIVSTAFWLLNTAYDTVLSPILILSRIMVTLGEGGSGSSSGGGDTRIGGIESLFGGRFSELFISEVFQFFIAWIILMTLCLGGLVLLWRVVQMTASTADRIQLYFSLAAGIVLVSYVALPHVSQIYSVSRIYAITMMLAAPTSVVGWLAVISFLQKSPSFRAMIPSGESAYIAVIFAFILAFSGAAAAGTAHPDPAYAVNSGGSNGFDYEHVSEQDMAASDWIGDYKAVYQFYTDRGYDRQKMKMGWDTVPTEYRGYYDGTTDLEPGTTEVEEGYVYLHEPNVERGVIDHSNSGDYRPYRALPDLRSNTHHVYDSGGSEVLYSSN